MGLWSTVKGWLNIGGVKVTIEGLNKVIKKDENKITAKVVLTTKEDKHVDRLQYKFLLKKTTGSGEQKQTKEYVIAQHVLTEQFDLKAGETKTLDLELMYSLEKTLADMGGVLGGIGKVASFLSTDKEEYFVVAQADVKGAAISASHWVPVTVK
jgi:sporulation-control protein spo0M